MSNSALRGRHAAVTKKNMTRVGASLAVTGGLVAGIATATTSGSSASEPTSARATLKPAAAAANAAPASPHQDRAEAKSAAGADTVTTTKAQARPAVNAQVASAQISRAQARRALSAHAQPKSVQADVRKASQRATVSAVPAASRGSMAVQAKAATPIKRVGVQPSASASTSTPQVQTVAATSSATTQQASAATPSASGGVISAAQRYSGVPYVWGGSSTSGADCSGYVAMVYKSVGKTLPHSSSAMQAMATPVSNPQPGDLVFSPGHVAIYAGAGKAYQALHPGTTSGLHPIYSSNVSYGRV